MKACQSLALLCLIAFAYGAKLVVPTAPENPAISPEERSIMVKKAGKAMEKLGNILQGGTGSINKGELEKTLNDLQASNLFLANNVSEEYFVPSLIRWIGDAIGTFGKVAEEIIQGRK